MFRSTGSGIGLDNAYGLGECRDIQRVKNWILAGSLGVAGAWCLAGAAPQARATTFYVSNYSSNQVTEVSATGTTSTFATGLDEPNGLAFNSAGDLFVANGGNSTLSEITPGGSVSTFASGLGTPQGVAISGGYIYVAGYSTNTVYKVSLSNGAVSDFATNLNGPTGLAFNSSGDLFVGEEGNNNPALVPSNSITEITPGGTVSTFVSSAFQNPQMITFDDKGNLWVVYANSNAVVKYNPTGDATTFASGNEFNDPEGVAFDAAGNVYITNGNSDNILEFSPKGMLVGNPFASTNFDSPNFMAATPEPGQYGLLALGLAAPLLLRKRHRTVG
ncbi:MAG: NHL repeat-containing protein [Phycisphaerae bacterium]